MDLGLHQISKCRVHSAMADERRLPLEYCADQVYAKVTAAVARTVVSDVAIAFILDDQLHRRECREQTRADLPDAIAQGSTLRNGRTSTRA